MATPGRYTREKILSSSRRSEVSLARSDVDGQLVVLKSYRDQVVVSPDARIERELAALRACAGPGVPRALEVVRDDQAQLVLEYLTGVTLDEWARNGLPPVGHLLAVGIQICDAIARVHQARFVHGDLSPHNVLISPATGEVHLIDFGMSHPLGAVFNGVESVGGSNAGRIHPYVAPEQTGRMNRGVDTRTDLYAVGATLYQLATGHTPFDTHDPLALLHAIMARIPTPPHVRRPDLPEPVSRIISKLLDKEPGERYPTARALRADLKACVEQLHESGTISSALELGGAAAPDAVRFGARLHGREVEIGRLRERFRECVRESPQLVLLAGEPGVGKSTLVEGLGAELRATNGYLLVGKFDPTHDRPYSGWRMALTSLSNQLLVESDERLSQWRQSLHAGLGELARVLVDLVPDFAFILGETHPVPMVGPRESQARLAVTLQRLIRVCGRSENPLVIFLDDLQWSDAASRNLLVNVMDGLAPAALLLLGAYRENEVGTDHPLTRTLSQLSHQASGVETIRLGALSLEAIVSLLAVALERTEDQVTDLASIVEIKTGNSPLFVRQLVEHLVEHELLRFVPGTGWTWDPAEIAGAEVPDGAVEIMAKRLEQLPVELRPLLMLASCLPEEFDVRSIAIVSGGPPDTIPEGLYGLLDAGVISTCSRGFRFVHDRVRETARALGDDEQRGRVHAQMARLLLERLSEAERDARLLEIAHYQAEGLAYLQDGESASALELQLRAGERALAAGAAATSEGYLASARTLFDGATTSWPVPTTVRVYLRSAESAYLRGAFDVALGWLETLERFPLDLVQRARVEAQRIQVLAITRGQQEVVDHALAVLRQLGVRWPARPSVLRLKLDLQFLCVEMVLRGAWRILRPATKVEPLRVARMLVLAQAVGAIGRGELRLLLIILIWSTRQNLRRGYIAPPFLSLVAVATSCLEFLHKPRFAQKLHDLAMAQCVGEVNPTVRLRTQLHSASHFLPWRSPRRSAIAGLDSHAEKFREAGDLEFANYSSFLKLVLGALAGDPVQPTAKSLGDLVERVERAQHVYFEPLCAHQAYACLCLSRPEELELEARMAAAEATLQDAGLNAASFGRSVWLMVLCVYGRYDLALRQSESHYEHLFKTLNLIHIADHVFFRGLAAGALATASGSQDRRRCRRISSHAERLLRFWARKRGSPDLAHMAVFLRAERERSRGHFDRARSCYDRALEGAIRQGYPHHAALALERRGWLLVARNQRGEGVVNLKEAARRYRGWGCELKAEALELEVSTHSSHM